MRQFTAFSQMMHSFLQLRRATAATAFALVAAVGAVACSDDSDFTAPVDIGIANSGVLFGAVEAGASDRSTGFSAGRSGPATVNVCGPVNAAAYTVQLLRGRDTVATRTASSGCVTFAFTAQQGATYRLDVRAGSARGLYTACYVIGDSTCVAPTPGAVTPGAPTAYYLNAEGKTGQALLTALFDIIKGQRVFSYDVARDSLYATVDDPDNDNVIIDIYDGRAASPVSSRATAGTARINAEHAWPQSRGAGEAPAQSDLHILFSADQDANGRRSNFPFGEVVDTTSMGPADAAGQRSVLGFNAGGVLVFEPRDSKKGDIARALFYFYTRYKPAPTPSFSLVNFNIEEPVILRWAQEDPVDDFERARHNLVFRVQQNRNPFIDRPEFLAAIGDFPNN